MLVDTVLVARAVRTAAAVVVGAHTAALGAVEVRVVPTVAEAQAAVLREAAAITKEWVCLGAAREEG